MPDRSYHKPSSSTTKSDQAQMSFLQALSLPTKVLELSRSK
jgi:hypothetical protein